MALIKKGAEVAKKAKKVVAKKKASDAAKKAMKNNYKQSATALGKIQGQVKVLMEDKKRKKLAKAGKTGKTGK